MSPQMKRSSTIRSLLTAILLHFPSYSVASDNNTEAHAADLKYNPSQGSAPVVEVKINGIPRLLVVDTGSPDTFVYTSGIKCVLGEIEQKSADACLFGDLYNGTFDRVDGVVFNQTYGTGLNASGPFGTATIEIAGVTIEDQRIAFVNRASRNTFIGANGILGMAPSGKLEAAWPGRDPAMAELKPGGNLRYPTVFESMYNDTQKVEPYFSILLNRESNNGSISFGSTVPETSRILNWTNVPFTSIDFRGESSTENYYPIQAGGYELNGVRNTSTFITAVDTGTVLSRLPDHIAETFNNAFDPPASLAPPLNELYMTLCNATVPTFGLILGGQLFRSDPEGLLLRMPGNDTHCVTAITKPFASDPQTFPHGFQVLGDLFLGSLVTEFDVGKQEMRFAERQGSGSVAGDHTNAPSSSPSSGSGPGPSAAVTSNGGQAMSVQSLLIVTFAAIAGFSM